MISNLFIKYEKLFCKLNAIILIFHELIIFFNELFFLIFLINLIKKITKRNTIEYLSIFIIEFAKLKYCIDTINQYQNKDFSLCLTENDIKSSEKITELTEYYSFVNEEIYKY